VIDVFKIKEMEGNFYISSEIAQMNGKYLIECSSKTNAEELKQRLINRSLPLPVENNDSYDKVDVFNGTPIYRVKQKKT
jgi:hypothetical protein